MKKQHETKVNSSEVAVVRLTVEKGKAEKTEFHFTKPFRIGRDPECEVQLSDPEVSRFHAEIWLSGDRWWVLDLQSVNGTFLDGKKVERAPLTERSNIELGDNGPRLSLNVEGIARAETVQIDPLSLTHYTERYFGDSTDDNIGTRTMMIRRAFKQVQQKQKRRFVWIIALFACLSLAAGIYGAYKHMEARKQRLLGEKIFYAMKSLELEFADFLKMAREGKDVQSLEAVKKYRAKRKEMEQSYDQFLASLEIYGEQLSQKERTIIRVARTFGECEINMPAGFVSEVLNYIKKWNSTPRLEEALSRAMNNNYTMEIVEAMLAHDLPPEFFYLALQESNFDVNACGPETRYGIAKGMWQFVPSTASYYGLRTGPLLHLRRPDPRDERHHFAKSTQAAARYLRDIYDTEAQASGLLVIASYNWGQRRVNRLIKKMPENPAERNFWRLLTNHRDGIPQQTYDYVFHIFSAAAIGENPQLFGFEFDNPLAHLNEKRRYSY